jgi:recombination protein RecT
MANVTVQTKSERVDTKLATLLEQNIGQMRAALPKHMTAERMIRLAMTTFRSTPLLQECTLQSVAGSIMAAAQLGLDIGVLGQAYLVPYRKQGGAYECQLIPGYMGLIELMYRSGRVSSVYTEPVYEGDHFALKLGMVRTIEHEPDLTSATRGDPAKLRLVYAVANLTDGGYVMEWMTRAEIDLIRKRSKASERGPWVTDYVEMAKKTVIRRLAKKAPKSIELHNAIELYAAADRHQPQGLTIDSAALLRHEPVQIEQDSAPEPTGEDESDVARQTETPTPPDPPMPTGTVTVMRDGTVVDESTGEIIDRTGAKPIVRSAPADLKGALE